MADFNPLEREIQNAIHARVVEIVNIEAKKAAIEVESQIREMAGQIATRVLSYVEMETFDKKLVITVDFRNLRENA